ncbi:MAG: hypothetical protein ACRDGA_04495 [Bacteroidota bacterium]
MAREVSRTVAKRGVRKESLPFTKRNYQILAIAILVIAAGYVALAQKPWDGLLPLVVAPILLVVGYCVLIPWGILYRSKRERDENALAPESNKETSKAVAS